MYPSEVYHHNINYLYKYVAIKNEANLIFHRYSILEVFKFYIASINVSQIRYCSREYQRDVIKRKVQHDKLLRGIVEEFRLQFVTTCMK